MIETAVNAGTTLSKDILNASGFGVVGFIAVVIVLFILAVAWLLVQAHLKQLPELTKSITDLTANLEKRMSSVEGGLTNLYIATQAVANEVGRVQVNTAESQGRSREAYSELKGMIENVQGKVDDMPQKLSIVVGGKKYESKKNA